MKKTNRQPLLNQRGFTLIEVIISFTLLSLIMLTVFQFNFFILASNRAQAQTLETEQNLRQAMEFIEKRLREMDSQTLEYVPAQQTFKARMQRPDSPGQMVVWVDFSGKNRNRLNTWLYHDETSKTLRVSKNREHNVLHLNIDAVEVEELTPGALVKITLTSTPPNTNNPEHSISQSMVFHLTYQQGEADS